MKIFQYWWPYILWMFIVFVLSSRQKIAVSESYTVSFLIFKTLHILEYACGYLLAYRGLINTCPQSMKRKIGIIAFSIVVLYAITDELHQRLVPTREGRLRDVIIDSIGAGIAWKLILPSLQRVLVKHKALAKLLELQ